MGGSHSVVHIDGGLSLDVRSLSVRERLSAAFRVDARIMMRGVPEPRELLGKGARVEMRAGDTDRVFIGYVCRVVCGEPILDDLTELRLRVVPRLHRLRDCRLSRVFQELSTVQIAAVVLSQYDIEVATELRNPPHAREVCVQRDETDFAFIHRLFAEEGFAYRIEAGASAERERLRILDHPAYPDLAGGPSLRYRPSRGDTAMRHEENDVSSFRAALQVVPGKVVLRAFDLQKPRHLHVASAERKDGETGAEVREDHGPYGEMQVAPQAAATILDQHARAAEVFLGSSECPRLQPGFGVALDEHDHAELNGDYAITAVHHALRPAEGGKSIYENRFEAVKRTTLLRPKRPRRRGHQTTETAIVVGPGNEEIHTDHLGRVRVRFHWDAGRSPPGASSCWIRVAQAWAGAGFGTQFIPRVGTEVVVAFLGGDPDRPLIVGCVPNVETMSPFPLPTSKTRSGVKTASSPRHAGGGANELSFEDEAGAEQVRLVAQRNYEVTVRKDMHTEVSGTAGEVVTGDRSLHVNGAHRVTVLGPAVTTLASSSMLQVGGDQRETVRGHYKLDVADCATVRVGGSLDHTVAAVRREEVKGSWSSHADSAYVLTVGSRSSKGQHEVQVHGASVQHTEGIARVTATDALVLTCGKSRIELRPEGITIEGPTVHVKGTESVAVEGKGPALRLGDRAEVTANEIKFRGKTSSLSLDDGAKLLGESISLGKGTPDRPLAEEAPRPGTKRFSVRLHDYESKPFGGKHYDLRVGGEAFEGSTSTDGLVQQDVPESAELATLELWLNGYPEGPRKRYTFALDELHGAETVTGVRERLAHLGYYRGVIDARPMDESTSGSLSAFQRDNHLPDTGRSNPQTQAKLVERNGH